MNKGMSLSLEVIAGLLRRTCHHSAPGAQAHRERYLCWAVGRRYQTLPGRRGHDPGARRFAELAKYRRHVMAHGSFRQEQARRDVGVRQAFGQAPEHVQFPRGEGTRVGAAGRAGATGDGQPLCVPGPQDGRSHCGRAEAVDDVDRVSRGLEAGVGGKRQGLPHRAVARRPGVRRVAPPSVEHQREGFGYGRRDLGRQARD